MSRKKKPLPILEQVEIEACAAEGKSLFHWDDLVVFVPFCVPGDIVDVQIRRKKHSFAEGEVVRFIQYSKVREEPRCKHFGFCGGCKWQNLPYSEQLKMKERQVKDQLTRIGKIELPEFRQRGNPKRNRGNQKHPGHRFPHHGGIRQDSAHREMLADG